MTQEIICRNCLKEKDCKCLCHKSKLFEGPHDLIQGNMDYDSEIAQKIRLGEDRRWGINKTEKDWID